jgi:hypothetical protein
MRAMGTMLGAAAVATVGYLIVDAVANAIALRMQTSQANTGSNK